MCIAVRPNDAEANYGPNIHTRNGYSPFSSKDKMEAINIHSKIVATYLIAHMMGDIPLSSFPFTSTPCSSTNFFKRSKTPKLASRQGSVSMLTAWQKQDVTRYSCKYIRKFDA